MENSVNNANQFYFFLLVNFLDLFQRNIKKDQKQKWKEVILFYEIVELLYYGLHKISLNRGGSYIDSPDWIKHKKATINPKSKDNNCFRDAITAALNHEKIKHNPERISNLKPFFGQYNWEGIEFPLH